MREVFRGWRRKFGVMTLVMALMVTGYWLRSFVTSDIFDGRNGFLLSSHGGITYTWWDESDITHMESNGMKYTIAKGSEMKSWSAPYWPVVFPLTLLSAYLLLSKPRVAKPDAVGEN